MKIRTVTFHRAHNHGSVLQAYALQTCVTNFFKQKGIECDYKIIDYFRKVQKELYSIIKSDLSLKGVVKNCIALRHYNSLALRHKRFNTFVEKYLNLTLRFDSEQSLRTAPPEGDIFISGSDQIWNVRAKDASTVYYLDFPTNGAKKISIAASFGPLSIEWGNFDKKLYSNLLNDYSEISVREDESALNVERLIGSVPTILADPTFLLNQDEWAKIESSDTRLSHPYILLYDLEPTKQQLNLVTKISKILDLPVVVLRFNNKNDWFNSFEKHYDAGPQEFLSYIKNAELVLTSSFHGTAFSIIYQKQFFVLDGKKDARISSILRKCGLMSQCIDSNDNTTLNIEVTTPKFDEALHFISQNLTSLNCFLEKILER